MRIFNAQFSISSRALWDDILRRATADAKRLRTVPVGAPVGCGCAALGDAVYLLSGKAGAPMRRRAPFGPHSGGGVFGVRGVGIGFEIILVELVAQCADADRQHPGGVRAVALALLERRQDVLLLDFAQRKEFA